MVTMATSRQLEILSYFFGRGPLTASMKHGLWTMLYETLDETMYHYRGHSQRGRMEEQIISLEQKPTENWCFPWAQLNVEGSFDEKAEACLPTIYYPITSSMSSLHTVFKPFKRNPKQGRPINICSVYIAIYLSLLCSTNRAWKGWCRSASYLNIFDWMIYSSASLDHSDKRYL